MNEVFEVDVRQEGNASIFALKGELTSNSEELLLTGYEELEEYKKKHVIFDLSACSYVNSSGIAAFITILHQTNELGGRLALIGLSSHLKKVFETVGLSEFIPIYGTLKQALSK